MHRRSELTVVAGLLRFLRSGHCLICAERAACQLAGPAVLPLRCKLLRCCGAGNVPTNFLALLDVLVDTVQISAGRHASSYNTWTAGALR